MVEVIDECMSSTHNIDNVIKSKNLQNQLKNDHSKLWMLANGPSLSQDERIVVHLITELKPRVVYLSMKFLA